MSVTINNPEIERIYRAILFVEENLREEVTIKDMADAACYSLYHFCRVFNRVTHHTPYDYLIRRRISEAGLEVLKRKRKIIDIAYDYQFGSPEVFSRVFKRMFGVLPSKIGNPAVITDRAMPALTIPHLSIRNDGILKKIRFNNFPEMELHGLMLKLKDKNGIMDILGKLQGEIPDTAKIYCVIHRIDTKQEEFIFIGTESGIKHSLDFVTKVIPGGEYISVSDFIPMDQLYLFTDYIKFTWLPKTAKHIDYNFTLIEIKFLQTDLIHNSIDVASIILLYLDDVD